MFPERATAGGCVVGGRGRTVNDGGAGRSRGIFELERWSAMSKTSGCGARAIEAMSVGCPVIAADNSSIRESVGTAGVLVPAGDVDSAVLAARGLNSAEAFASYEAAGLHWASAFEANKCAGEFVCAFEREIWPVNGNQDRKDYL